LGIGRLRVRQLILKGRLPAEKFGRDWMIQERDLEKVKVRVTGRPKKRGVSYNGREETRRS
jgi:excisionase family DNA binding protein